MPEGQKAGPKGRQLEVGVQGAPGLLVAHKIRWLAEVCNASTHVCPTIKFYNHGDMQMEHDRPFLSKPSQIYTAVSRKACLAQRITPEIKHSAELALAFSNCDISETKRDKIDPLVPKRKGTFTHSFILFWPSFYLNNPVWGRNWSG